MVDEIDDFSADIGSVIDQILRDPVYPRIFIRFEVVVFGRGEEGYFGFDLDSEGSIDGEEVFLDIVVV